MPFPSSATPRPVARRPVEVRFLAGTRQQFFLDELPAILRHPAVLLYFAGSILACFGVSVLLDRPTAVPYILLFPVLAFANVTGMLSFALWVNVKSWVLRGDEPIRIFLTLPLIVCILIVQSVTLLSWNLVLEVPTAPLKTSLLVVTLIYVLDELLLHFIVRPRTAQIVADVRSFTGAAPRHAEAEAPPPQGAMLQAGNLRLPAASVLHMQAQGNYVVIHSDSGTHQVPGPFSALVAQLPDGLGALVHRSEWVASRAVTSARRERRSTLLGLSTGQTVRVAATRTGPMRDWLASLTDPPRRRPYSTGGGEAKRQSRPLDDVSTTSAKGDTAPSSPKAPDSPTNT